MIVIRLLFIALAGSCIIGCSYNKDEPIAPEFDKEGDGQKTPQITYNTHVKNIIDNNCISCHSSTGGQSPFLTDYNSVFNKRLRIEDRAIKNIPSAMPPGNPLTPALKDTLQLWINQGAQQ